MRLDGQHQRLLPKRQPLQQQPLESRDPQAALSSCSPTRLHHDNALPVGRLPHIGEVVDALAPFVDQQRRRLAVRRFDPVGEEVALVSLVPEVLRGEEGWVGGRIGGMSQGGQGVVGMGMGGL